MPYLLRASVNLCVGDRLIRANRRFAQDLDGIYHRGEIYLRWLQRLSSTAFGTYVGRFLTRYLILPFGGAYVALEGLHHVVELFHHSPEGEAAGVRYRSVKLEHGSMDCRGYRLQLGDRVLAYAGDTTATPPLFCELLIRA